MLNRKIRLLMLRVMKFKIVMCNIKYIKEVFDTKKSPKLVGLVLEKPSRVRIFNYLLLIDETSRICQQNYFHMFM